MVWWLENSVDVVFYASHPVGACQICLALKKYSMVEIQQTEAIITTHVKKNLILAATLQCDYKLRGAFCLISWLTTAKHQNIKRYPQFIVVRSFANIDQIGGLKSRQGNCCLGESVG